MTRTFRAPTVPLLGLCLALLTSAAATQPQLRYRVTTITPPNAKNLINPPDIDYRGRVAGSTYTGSLTEPTPPTDVAPFLRTRHGAFVDLETLPGATASAVSSIGQNGTVAGTSGTNLDTNSRAVIWDRRGRVTDIGVLNPGDTVAWATDVDFLGRVMGMSGTANNLATTGFVWHRGVFAEVVIPGRQFSDLVAFGGLGSIAGSAWDIALGFDSEGFIIDRHGNVQMIGVLPGGSSSAILDMNLFGTAVGVADDGMFPNAVVYKGGTLTSLGTLPGDFVSFAFGINNWGTVVGVSVGPVGPRAVLSRFGGALEDLGAMLDPATTNVALVQATGINDWGHIVAEGFDPSTYPPQLGPPGATFTVLLTPYFE